MSRAFAVNFTLVLPAIVQLDLLDWLVEVFPAGTGSHERAVRVQVVLEFAQMLGVFLGVLDHRRSPETLVEEVEIPHDLVVGTRDCFGVQLVVSQKPLIRTSVDTTVGQHLVDVAHYDMFLSAEEGRLRTEVEPFASSPLLDHHFHHPPDAVRLAVVCFGHHRPECFLIARQH